MQGLKWAVIEQRTRQVVQTERKITSAAKDCSFSWRHRKTLYLKKQAVVAAQDPDMSVPTPQDEPMSSMNEDNSSDEDEYDLEDELAKIGEIDDEEDDEASEGSESSIEIMTSNDDVIRNAFAKDEDYIEDPKQPEDQIELQAHPTLQLPESADVAGQNAAPDLRALLAGEYKLGELAIALFERKTKCRLCKTPLDLDNCCWTVSTSDAKILNVQEWCRQCRAIKDKVRYLSQRKVILHNRGRGLERRVKKVTTVNFHEEMQVFADFHKNWEFGNPTISAAFVDVILNFIDSGSAGMPGSEAFERGRSEKERVLYRQVKSLDKLELRCAGTGLLVTWNDGDRSQLFSIDRSRFITNEQNEITGTYNYWSSKQNTVITSLGWNLYGGRRDFNTRWQALEATAKVFNKTQQRLLWQGRDAFATTISGMVRRDVKNQKDLDVLLLEAGIKTFYTLEDWRFVIKRVSAQVRAQTLLTSAGRSYASEPSSVFHLALIMLYWTHDALSGEPVPLRERSLDAITIYEGHNLHNVVCMTKWHNYWKSSLAYTFSRKALMEWVSTVPPASQPEVSDEHGDLQLADLLRNTFAKFVESGVREGKKQQPDLIDLTGIDFSSF